MKRIIVFAVLAAAACGGSTDVVGVKKPKLRFAVIPKSLDIPVFNYAKIGAEREAARRGDVEVIWRGPENADQLKQKEILESFITQHVDGIAISCLNGDFLTDTINRAVDAGIPVVTWDADAPKSKRLAFYGVDDLAAGRILGEQTAALLNGKGKVAIITSYGATNLERRLQGVREALAKFKDIQIVETYDIKEDPVHCSEIIASGTNRYPDLAAWISVGGWPVFTRNALDTVPAHTKVISFDTIPPAPDLLKQGKVQVLLGQKYFGWGSESVRLLSDVKAGKMPDVPIIDSGVDVVTSANVDAYVASWKVLEKQ
ncbi:MAG TPA: sugar-binding protein [Vicinamibacterales bacterium]|jgi:ribose transport system substrate-binding protein